MYILFALTGAGLILSLLKDRGKTMDALKTAWKKFSKILPAFLTVLILISVILYLLPDHVISAALAGRNKYLSLLSASLIGSITMMPGFVAYPLCGILLKKGVSYMVLSGFTTTLMMVGILTIPLERKYFGIKVTVIRNVTGFLMALTVALITGLIFHEI